MLQVAKATPPFMGGVEAEWTQPPQVHPKGFHGRAVAIALAAGEASAQQKAQLGVLQHSSAATLQ